MLRFGTLLFLARLIGPALVFDPLSVGNGPGDINCYDWGPSELSLGKDQPKHTRAVDYLGAVEQKGIQKPKAQDDDIVSCTA